MTNYPDDTDVFDLLLMDCHDFTIQREWHNIDILAVSHAARFVLVIENKIDSGEHDNQLDRYRKTVNDAYPQYKKMFIFLSPDGMESSDPDNWCPMGYQDILNILVNAKRKVKLPADAELLIQNYLDIIRRDIVGDEELSRICAEIYAKHQKALDLIYENRPDRASDLSAILKSWATEMTAKGEMEIVPEKCVKTCTRFKTETMSKLLPDAEKPLSGWGTNNHYFYEIKNNDGKEFFIQLVFSAKDIPDDLREMCERINRFYPTRLKKVDWQWRTVFSTRHSKIEDELSEEKIFDQLNKKWEEICQFEKKLLSQLEEAEKHVKD